ncbi:hypothetical protein J6590_014274 [Homalodisca vitripennis]|nr:hypothetical protein J6590_014274 [Homalodisca vitripennis]
MVTVGDVILVGSRGSPHILGYTPRRAASARSPLGAPHSARHHPYMKHPKTPPLAPPHYSLERAAVNALSEIASEVWVALCEHMYTACYVTTRAGRSMLLHANVMCHDEQRYAS